MMFARTVVLAVALAAHGVSAKGAISCPVVLKNSFGSYLAWYANMAGADGTIMKWFNSGIIDSSQKYTLLGLGWQSSDPAKLDLMYTAPDPSQLGIDTATYSSLSPSYATFRAHMNRCMNDNIDVDSGFHGAPCATLPVYDVTTKTASSSLVRAYPLQWINGYTSSGAMRCEIVLAGGDDDGSFEAAKDGNCHKIGDEALLSGGLPGPKRLQYISSITSSFPAADMAIVSSQDALGGAVATGFQGIAAFTALFLGTSAPYTTVDVMAITAADVTNLVAPDGPGVTRNYVTYMATYMANTHCWAPGTTETFGRIPEIPAPPNADALWHMVIKMFTVMFGMDRMDCVMGFPGTNIKTALDLAGPSGMWKCVDDPSGAACAVTGSTPGRSAWYVAGASAPQEKWVKSSLACSTALAPSKTDTRTAWHGGSCCDTSSNCDFAHKIDYVKQDGTSVSEQIA